MKMGGGKIVAEALKAEGVRFVFGIPGTHNIELYDAMMDVPELTPVLVTDEQSAGFLADGVARSGGGLAAVNVVPGAGLTHALSGIAEAFLDQTPLLVLACGIRLDSKKAFQLHDVDQAAIAKPICKAVFKPQDHQDLYRFVREACRIARQAPAGPVMVEVPANLYLLTGEIDFSNEDALLAQIKSEEKKINDPDFKEAVDLLKQSKKTALYLGQGALSAGADLMRLAEQLDAIVFTTLSAKGVFPENHFRWAWNIMGQALPPELRKIEKEIDCVLAIGCRFGEVATASYGFNHLPNLIHVDIDARVFNKNYPARVTVQADAKEFVTKLLSQPQSGEKKQIDRTFFEKVKKAHELIREDQEKETKTPEKVLPAKLFKTLQEVFGEQTVFVADSGNGTFLTLEQTRLNHPRSFLAPIDYSCMGYSVPAAIGAKLAHPEKPVVALVGDGAFLMTGLEMLTAKSYGAGVTFIVLRDRELSQIAQFQRAALVRTSCTELFEYDACLLASAVGVESFKINAHNKNELHSILTRAHQMNQEKLPVLIEVEIDYSKPTYFSSGVVKTNFLRFSWGDRLRLVGRVLGRKFLRS